jgi:hypothetical protein
MKAYWTDEKPDGTKITDGRVCRVLDPEDGSAPIRVYGKDQEAVLSKIERTSMLGQSLISELKKGAGKTAAGPQLVPARSPDILTADETLQLTEALQDPKRAAEASERLARSHRALEHEKAQAFERTATAWAATHPELKDSLYNKKLITDNARMRVGGRLEAIRTETLEMVYQELTAGGYLLTQEEAALENSTSTPAVPPAETPAPVPSRQEGAFATSHRATRLNATQQATWQPKYTRAQLEKLTTKETDRLLKDRGQAGKDYREACDFWYGARQQATA